MAVAAAQYYFRFRICWCPCLQKVKIYQQAKFRRFISIHGLDITTSGLEKQTSAILEFYFLFRSRPFRRNRRVILHQAAEFRPNRTTQRGNMTLYRFSRWRPSAMLFLLFGVMADHPRNAFHGLKSVLKSLICRINSSGNIAMYRFWRSAYSRLFWGAFGAYFPHMTSLIVQTPKRTILGRKHVVWAIQRENRCDGSTWACEREKITLFVM